MALLDVALKTFGVRSGEDQFPLIRDLAVALSPPWQFVVNNCFVRILKPWEDKKGKSKTAESEDVTSVRRKGMFINNVALRQYVYYNGPLGLALEVTSKQDAALLSGLLLQINYLGKRGSFFQLDSPPTVREQLPARQGYLRLDRDIGKQATNLPTYTLQLLDDCGPTMTFEHADIYSGEPIRLGKERILRHVVLPYQLTRSSRSFSLYERIP
jgi:hypothetical protein